MDNLDDVLQAIAADPKRGVFVSRSGEEKQRELAIWIASRLKANGYIPILQDTHFRNTNFMLAMDAALAAGVRVLALMSREYLKSQNCMTEALSALDDQRNTNGRLILFRIDDCQPMGLLRYVDRVDFSAVWRPNNDSEMERVLISALALNAPGALDARYLLRSEMDASQIVHPQILMHDENAFTGREEDLARLRDLLWNGGTAALTRAGVKGLIDEGVLAGMGGIGKTTLARAYAFRNRGEYHAVWWLRAESEAALVDDLIELGAKFDPTLAKREDRPASAREALSLIAKRQTNRPWLLVYDNAPGPGVVGPWRPERNAHVIVTSRNPAWDAAVPLDVFTPAAAVEFLCDTANRKQPKDREEAAALAEQLGRLPLALAHAASKCRSSRRITFADYGRRLAEFWADKPGERAAHGKYPRSVYATFTMALDEIAKGGPAGDPAPCPQAETVMGVLAHLAPDQVPEFVLAQLCDGDGAAMAEAALDQALEELAAVGLVTWGEFEDGAPNLNVHRLVQEVMRARLAAQGRSAEIATLATRAVHFSFDWHTGTVAGELANGRWLAHADRVLEFAPDAGDGENWATWIALFMGDHQLSRGSTTLAAAGYQRARSISDRLAKADPANAGWQRDLSVSHNKIGDVLRAQGNLAEALDAFKASLAIAMSLSKADPGNAGWQRDLSVARSKLGEVLFEQGDRPAALDAFKAAHAIFERLAKADPGNAGWQRDLAISNERIGDMHAGQGHTAEAIAAFERALGVYRELNRRNPDDIPSHVNSVVPLWRLGGLKGTAGRADLESALAILKPLAEADRLDARRRGWIAQIEAQIAGLSPAPVSAPAPAPPAKGWLGRLLKR